MKNQTILRRSLLLGAPLLLGILEIWHPESVVFGDLVTSPDKAKWWLTLHLIQLPLFGLLAAAMYFILDGVKNIAATISRIALWFFIVYYTALDAVAGIATGIIFNNVQALQLTNAEDPLFNIIFDIFLPVFSLDAPGASVISQIAVVSWFVAALSAAIALYMKGLNHAGVLLIATTALTFQSHAYPFGPMSMFILAAGIYLIEFYPWKLTEVKQHERS